MKHMLTMHRESPLGRFFHAGCFLTMCTLAGVSCGPENGNGSGGTGGSGGDTTSSTSGTTSSETDSGSSDPNVLVGTFQIELIAPVPASDGNPGSAGKTTVLGKIYDGPTLSQVVWELKAESGDCKLVTPRVPFCSTPCGGSAVCVEDETCEAYPKAHSAGVVTATGLNTTDGKTTFEMSPVANNYQVPTGTTLKYPAFAKGDVIQLEAAGEYFPAFNLLATGIDPLVLSGDPIPVTKGSSVALNWTAGLDNKAGIHVKLDISHHGGTKGMIECDTQDDGNLTLDSSLVDALLDLGVAGFPTVVVSRRSTGSTVVPSGRVDLVIVSSVEHSVQIEGLVSCTDDVDCPNGQTCQTDLTCK